MDFSQIENAAPDTSILRIRWEKRLVGLSRRTYKVKSEWKNNETKQASPNEE